ncbi:SAP30-binding protein [Marchantia polymorpha subsp. ruderalis]|uniref:SAP30-binding protein n=2 Tax=Marchantia polymorpha TaxID=3197 RepID=A0A176VDP9_MARPO|nr:hypothetical protein AXG93_3810s1340 [Marchantia polymorpha subsp. ruderalis]PTQ43906.1 hypothetical protein MARPO_0022s0014 [Marchantia polymorpha]BBN04494.1 hypothetical protein Mp_3g05140 [Marchantia polymorpha subsp. ruderalis]|eukprot:PTQ43906.1 hypothetical protein MARPO_0022s0014 [Marchantia polymorpha]
MAGKRKAEGIALLSVYAGSDDDDDAASESSDEEEENQRENEQEVGAPLAADVTSGDVVGAVSAPRAGVRVAASGLGIVDYAHDEAAASPEPGEDVEADNDGRPPESELEVDNGNLQVSPNGIDASTPSKVTTPKLEGNLDGSGAIQSGETANTQDESGGEVDKEQSQVSVAMELDVLHDFLPPAPTATYSEELQTKFSKYLALKKTGRSLNEQLRNTKGYRNPDFLQRAVKYHEIDQIGSCFKKEVFDPHGYDQADYYDALALEQRREAERKEQERKQNQSQRVDFVRGGMQGGLGVTKPTLPLIHKIVTVTTSTETVKVDARSSKKSKWDKVELEGRSAQSIAADAIAAANVHAALLSASANAGAGYASFAQQRRREAEEKLRATEKNALTSSSSKVEKKPHNRS